MKNILFVLSFCLHFSSQAQTQGIHLFDFDSIGNESCLAFFEMQDGYFLCNNAVPVGQYSYYNFMKYDSSLTDQKFVNKQIYGFPQDGIELNNGNIVITGSVSNNGNFNRTLVELSPEGETLQFIFDTTNEIAASCLRISQDEEDNIYMLNWGLCPDSMQNNGMCLELTKRDANLTPVWRRFANEDTVYNNVKYGRFILQDNGDLVVALIKRVPQFFQYETATAPGCGNAAEGPQARYRALDVIKFDNDGNELFRKTIYDDSPFDGAYYINLLDKGNGGFMVLYQADSIGGHLLITKHFNNLGEVDSTKFFFPVSIICNEDGELDWDIPLRYVPSEADAVSKNGYEGVQLLNDSGGSSLGNYTVLHFDNNGDLLCRKYVLFGDYVNNENEIDLTLIDSSSSHATNIVVMRGITMLSGNRYALFGSIDTTNYVWLDEPDYTGWFQYTVDRNPFVFIDTLGCSNENKLDTLVYLDNHEIVLANGDKIDITLTPNPVYDLGSLTFSKPLPFESKFQIVDQTGKELFSLLLPAYSNGLKDLDLNTLPIGYHVWNLISRDQRYSASGWLLKVTN